MLPSVPAPGSDENDTLADQLPAPSSAALPWPIWALVLLRSRISTDAPAGALLAVPLTGTGAASPIVVPLAGLVMVMAGPGEVGVGVGVAVLVAVAVKVAVAVGVGLALAVAVLVAVAVGVADGGAAVP